MKHITLYLFLHLCSFFISCGSDKAEEQLSTQPDLTAGRLFVVDNSVGLPTARAGNFQLEGNVGQPLITEMSAPPFKLQSGFIPQSQLKR